jgi:UDPglucose--hexose-1-phosphate uridylyltransferase
MSEYRHDPLRGRWTLVAPERGARPGALGRTTQRGAPRPCQFCAGHEDETPPELLALRSPGAPESSWQVRVVPNRYPAVMPDLPETPGTGFNSATPGTGRHEVIIASPRHLISFSELDDELAVLAFEAWRQRLRAAREDSSLAHAQLFQNVGPAAGASVEHVHSQLLATALVPPAVQAAQAAAATWLLKHRRCGFCEMLDRELASGERIVEFDGEAVALCPFASRVPYEIVVYPRRHAAALDLAAPDDAARVARLLRRVLARLEVLLDRPAYNLIVHNALFPDERAPHWHWHVEIVPRLVAVAGYEWATGVWINPVAPERAAQQLRAGAAPGGAPTASATLVHSELCGPRPVAAGNSATGGLSHSGPVAPELGVPPGDSLV